MPATPTRRARGAITGALALCLLAASAVSAPQFEIRRLGYHPNGWDPDQWDQLELWTDGWIIGSTHFPSSDETIYWLHDLAADVYSPLGLDDEHHSPLGDHGYYSGIDMLASTGYIAGASERIDPSAKTIIGQSAWVFDPHTRSTTEAGLTGPAFTDWDGFSYSEVRAMNGAGQAAGISEAFDGSGDHAWYYDPASRTTREIVVPHEFGKTMQITDIAENGLVIGSHVAAGNWLYDPVSNSTTPITGPPDTPYDLTALWCISASGLIAGTTYSVEKSVVTGSDPWVYDIATGQYRHIVTGIDWSPDSGLERAVLISDAGVIAGAGDAYSSQGLLYSVRAWRYDNDDDTASEIAIPGSQSISPLTIDDQGRIFGNVSVTVARSGTDIAFWLDDPGAPEAILLGPHDDVHLGGIRGCAFVGEGRYVGSSLRGDDGTLGRTAWAYNANTGELHTFDLSVRSDGYASSTAFVFTDRDVVLGDYEQIGPNGESLGRHPFRWTRNEGGVDLNTHVTGDQLADFGVSELPAPIDGGQVPSNYLLYTGVQSSQTTSDQILLVLMEIPDPPCNADIDGDFDTDIFDFGIFARAFGATGLPPFTGGDLDGNGTVDIFDFGEFATDFGCNP